MAWHGDPVCARQRLTATPSTAAAEMPYLLDYATISVCKTPAARTRTHWLACGSSSCHWTWTLNPARQSSRYDRPSGNRPCWELGTDKDGDCGEDGGRAAA